MLLTSAIIIGYIGYFVNFVGLILTVAIREFSVIKYY